METLNCPSLERLEERLLAAIVSAAITSAGVLVLRGDANPTNATISQDTQVQVKDWSNGFAFVCASSAVRSVTWAGGSSSDRVDARGLHLPFTAWAGSGSDLIWGGSAGDFISAELAYGGLGRDWRPEYPAVAGDRAADVQQGSSPICSYLSVLASVSEHEDLAGRIRYRGGFSFDVPFRHAQQWAYVRVRFDGRVSAADPLPVIEGELWTILYARAWASFRHGDVIAYPDVAFVALTGQKPASFGPWAPKPLSYAYLVAELAQGKSLVAATYEDAQSPLVGLHAYSVLGASNGLVLIRNVWGQDGPYIQGRDEGLLWISWDAIAKGCWCAWSG